MSEKGPKFEIHDTQQTKSKFEINGIREIPEDQRLVTIDNGAFKIDFTELGIRQFLHAKGLTPDEQTRIWNDILTFKSKVDEVDKTQTHIGSTDAAGAIGDVIYGVVGEGRVSYDDIQALFAKKK